MHAAFDELRLLSPDGIQLTPGNAPTVAFDAHIDTSGVPVRTHHGFCLDAIRTPVWDDDNDLLGAWDSVHPPRQAAPGWLPGEGANVVLETMYPGYPLGSGGTLEAAMDMGLKLAIDISHVHIQMSQGAMQASHWRRLQDYDQVTEIHLSANDGARDQHQPLTRDTFGLAWAHERANASGIPVVIECYMHKLSLGERQRQVAFAGGR